MINRLRIFNIGLLFLLIFNFSKLKDRTQDFVFVKQSCLLSDSEWFQNAISRKEQIKNSNHLEQSAQRHIHSWEDVISLWIRRDLNYRFWNNINQKSNLQNYKLLKISFNFTVLRATNDIEKYPHQKIFWLYSFFILIIFNNLIYLNL